MNPTQEYLNAIADRLWDGQASLFVGAGFSKNAILHEHAHLPPSWNELGDLFFERSRNRKPCKRSDQAYANVLRLAEEVETMYGRRALIDLIKNALNDDLLIPSDTHMQLLALPWRDVYTTNYDTLLERSAARLKEQNKQSYTTITNSQEIGVASSPLLVKLHGDINDPSSIVITEEDYRTYPVKHPAMINHIQNTIITKTLVLMGFSGNDPNFIEWIGWVRDALSNKQKKVYLLSIDHIPEATRRTFEAKNVVVVDLMKMAGKGASPSENMATAIKFLGEYSLRRGQEKTDYQNKALKWGRQAREGLSLDKTFESWKKDRDTYPGWLVMPREKREYWANTEGFYLSQERMAQLKEGTDILFLDLFNWRIEKSLFPVENSWEDIYLSVINRYKPFSRRCSSGIRLAWLNLKLALMRLYRQEGWVKKWDQLQEELVPLKEKMEDEQLCRFEYEQALEAVYRNDFKTLEDVLTRWEKSKSDPYWDIRRGALWAEYLSLEKGKKITREAFDRICLHLEQSTTERERFFWASRKVHAHTVWNCMAQANFSDGSEETASARKTWLELRPYDDIWYEREFFESHLRPVEEVLRVKKQTASFRLGYSSTSTNMSGNSKDYRVAYAFFLYYEETGFPIHLPYLSSIDKTSLEKALSVMSHSSLPIAESWTIRSGDSQMVQAVYNRRFLERVSFGEVDAIYRRYQHCFKNLLQKVEKEEAPSWILAFRSVIPEILSRLCMKASLEARLETLNCIEAVFKEKELVRFFDLDVLLSSLISSFSEKEIEALIPRFARMTIAQGRYGDCRLEPLFYVRHPYRIWESLSGVIDELLERMEKCEKEGKVILYRLNFLNKCKALSKEQQEKLAEILWSKRDESGFPTGTIFSRFAFLSFPFPLGIEPQTLLREYFRNQPLPIVGNNPSVSFYGGHIPILNDYIGTTNEDISFTWDAVTLNRVCEKLICMWDTDKAKLLEEDNRSIVFSIKDDVKERFEDVETVVSTVMAPNFHLLTVNNQAELRRLVSEFEPHGMPSLRMRVAIYEIDNEGFTVDDELQTRLCSSDERVIEDCVKALMLLYLRGEDILKGVEGLSEYFRCGTEQGRRYIISGLNFFAENGFFKGDSIIRKNLLLGLLRLFDDTLIERADDELTANKKMTLRKLVAPLVGSLLQNASGETSSILNRWHGYYTSDNTCWDIKNHYDNLILHIHPDPGAHPKA